MMTKNQPPWSERSSPQGGKSKCKAGILCLVAWVHTSMVGLRPGKYTGIKLPSSSGPHEGLWLYLEVDGKPLEGFWKGSDLYWFIFLKDDHSYGKWITGGKNGCRRPVIKLPLMVVQVEGHSFLDKGISHGSTHTHTHTWMYLACISLVTPICIPMIELFAYGNKRLF